MSAALRSGQAVNDGLEDWEIRVLEAEDQPALYDVLEVIWLRRTIPWVLILTVVVNVLHALPTLYSYFDGLGHWLRVGDPLNNAMNAFFVLLSLLDSGLWIALAFLGLRALMHILRILMEMEFRSRKAL